MFIRVTDTDGHSRTINTRQISEFYTAITGQTVVVFGHHRLYVQENSVQIETLVIRALAGAPIASLGND